MDCQVCENKNKKCLPISVGEDEDKMIVQICRECVEEACRFYLVSITEDPDLEDIPEHTDYESDQES